MARISKGVLGGFQGKVGNVVGSNWREIDYIRSLPRRSNRPPSEKQLMQRLKFRVALNFMKKVRHGFELGYVGNRPSRSSVYADCLGHVMNDAVVGQYPDFKIDYSKVEISRGRLLGLNNLSWHKTADGKLKFVWINAKGMFNSEDEDHVLVLLMDKINSTVWLFGSSQRKELSLEISLMSGVDFNNLVAWVFVQNRTRDDSSNSTFLSDVKELLKP